LFIRTLGLASDLLIYRISRFCLDRSRLEKRNEKSPKVRLNMATWNPSDGIESLHREVDQAFERHGPQFAPIYRTAF
jgi:hypothetical protein